MMVNRPLSRFRDAFNVKIMYNNLDNVLQRQECALFLVYSRLWVMSDLCI